MIIRMRLLRLPASSKANRNIEKSLYPRGKELSEIDDVLESMILDLLNQRDPGKTICPSDAARRVAPHGWRPLMEQTRAAARRLVARGEIVMTQRGKVVDPSHIKGAVRLRKT